MQPTFLPWLGYFDLMDQVDHFVYLDTVQFSKQSWQQRNRIQTANGLSWLTVPVDTKGSSSRSIDSIRLKPHADFPERCLALIDVNYRAAPFRSMLDPVVERLQTSTSDALLCDLLFGLLDDLRTVLGVSTPTSRSSEMAASGRRSELVIELVREVGGSHYVTPPGTLGYLVEDAPLFSEASLPVDVQRYEHPTYPQMYQPFEPYASVVDLIANVGPSALDVLRSGRRPVEHLDVALADFTLEVAR